MLINFNNTQSSKNISFKQVPINPRISQRQLEELVNAGKKPAEIAKIFDVCVYYIYPIMRKYNILPPQKAMHKNIEDTVLPLIKKGYSKKVITQMTGIKSVDIKKMCDRLGLKHNEIRKKLIAKMIKAGHTDKEIAEKLQMKPKAVEKWVQKFELAKDRKNTQKKTRIANIINLLKTGYKNKEIAKKLNINEYTLNGIICKHKLSKYRKPKQTKIEIQKASKQNKQKSLESTIAKMLAQGKSVLEISLKTQKSPNFIYTYLRNNNIVTPRKNKIELEEPLYEIVEKMALEGAKIKEIIKETGLYRNKIMHFLQSKGIDIKAIQEKIKIEKAILQLKKEKNEKLALTKLKNLNKKPKTAPTSPVLISRIKNATELYEKGISIKRIAKILNKTESTIQKYLKDYDMWFAQK